MGKKKDKSEAGPKNEEKTVRLGDLRQGPVRHENLPPEMLEKIGGLYEVIGPYLTMPLETFELGFMRDMHPEREIAVWSAIALGFLEYCEKYHADAPMGKEEGRNVVGALILLSMGVDDPAKMRLSVETADRVIACYKGVFESEED